MGGGRQEDDEGVDEDEMSLVGLCSAKTSAVRKVHDSRCKFEDFLSESGPV